MISVVVLWAVALFKVADDRRSADEICLVDHAPGTTACDANEDALVEPVQRGCGCFDLRRGAERVLAGVDVLAATETREDLGAAVANAARLNVQEIAVFGLQRVADLAQRRAVRRHGLPIRAGARDERPAQLGP